MGRTATERPPMTDEARELAARHEPLARRIAAKWAKRYPSLADEFLSRAGWQLCLAATIYRNGPVTFECYAAHCVNYGLMKAVTDRRVGGRRVDDPRVFPFPDDWDASPAVYDTFPRLDAEDFDALTAGLPPTWARALELVYRGGLTQDEAAAELGCSGQWVSTLCRGAVNQIRKRLKASA